MVKRSFLRESNMRLSVHVTGAPIFFDFDEIYVSGSPEDPDKSSVVSIPVGTVIVPWGIFEFFRLLLWNFFS